MTLRERLELFKNKGWKYNPETGEVFSHTGRNNINKNGFGYSCCGINLKGKKITVYAHQLAYYLTYNEIVEKPYQIDHIDRNKANNKISNLRKITARQNMWNIGYEGSSWNTKSQKWRSLIMVNKKRISLGRFKTKEEAHQAYLDAKEIYHKIQ